MLVVVLLAASNAVYPTWLDRSTNNINPCLGSLVRAVRSQTEPCEDAVHERRRGRTSRLSAISERLTNTRLHRISGQMRRVDGINRREKKRRVAAEPMIGHVKVEQRMGRNELNSRDGDRANAISAATGDNLSSTRPMVRGNVTRALQATPRTRVCCSGRLTIRQQGLFTDDFVSDFSPVRLFIRACMLVSSFFVSRHQFVFHHW